MYGMRLHSRRAPDVVGDVGSFGPGLWQPRLQLRRARSLPRPSGSTSCEGDGGRCQWRARALCEVRWRTCPRSRQPRVRPVLEESRAGRIRRPARRVGEGRPQFPPHPRGGGNTAKGGAASATTHAWRAMHASGYAPARRTPPSPMETERRGRAMRVRGALESLPSPLQPRLGGRAAILQRPPAYGPRSHPVSAGARAVETDYRRLGPPARCGPMTRALDGEGKVDR